MHEYGRCVVHVHVHVRMQVHAWVHRTTYLYRRCTLSGLVIPIATCWCWCCVERALTWFHEALEQLMEHLVLEHA